MVNSTASACPKPWKATSDGAWGGENPLHYALPLLVVQLVLIVTISRILFLICRPFRQPRVIAEIIGGLVLGTSCFGYIPHFTENIFPTASLTVLTTFANLGLLFFLFMVGMELDLRSLMKTGTAALTIAGMGICLPFAMGVGTSFAIKSVLGLDTKFGPFIVFMGVAMSITAFPVLARILAERKLLTTDVGQIAMSAAAVNDVVAWVLLALAVALSSTNASASVVAWILLSGIGFVIFMFVVVRPIFALITRQVVDHEPIPEGIVAITLICVVLFAMATDAIGIHGIFGAFIFGLIVPKDGPFVALILEKIEDFTSIILLPLYFASSGLSTKLESVSNGRSAGLVFLVIATACIGKIGGTMLAAMANKIEFRKALVLGVLMNTKGLVELIVLNIGLQKNVINQEIFSIMVIMALFTTFITTPLVMLIYEPARDKLPYTRTRMEGVDSDEMRMLVCLHGMKNLPAMLNLTEVSRGTRRHPLRIFLMHLIEFSERSSAIRMVTKVRKDGKPFWSGSGESRDQVVVAFQTFSQLSKVNVQPVTVISGFNNMHEDICATAAEKRANIIILPFHKYQTPEGTLEVGNPGFTTVNRRVLRHAPCSVAILVDRGLGGHGQLSPSSVANRVAVFFFGGPDDREALVVGRRIAEHPGVSLTVVHFKASADAALAFDIEKASEFRGSAHGQEQKILGMTSFFLSTDKGEVEAEEKKNDEALRPLIGPSLSAETEGGEENAKDEGKKRYSYEVREVEDAGSAIVQAGKEPFDLIIVGRGRRPVPLVAKLLAEGEGSVMRLGGRLGLMYGQTQQVMDGGGPASSSSSAQAVQVDGLGPVGDILCLPNVTASILVVQQHDPSLVKNRPEA